MTQENSPIDQQPQPYKDTDEMLTKEIGRGVGAGILAVVVTAAVVVVSLNYSGDSAAANYFGDPWVFLDVAVTAFLTFLLWRRWRWAGVILIVLAVIGTIDKSVALGRPSGLFMTIVLLWLWYRAARACFILHRRKPKIEARKRRWVKWAAWGIGGPVGLIVVVLVGVLLLGEMQIITDSNVRPGADLRAKDRTLLAEAGVLKPEDHIEYYFFDGFWSAREGGTILTKTDLVMFWDFTEDAPYIERTPLSKINGIEQIQEYSWADFAVWNAKLETGGELEIWLDDEDGVGSKFIDRLKTLSKIK